MNLKWLTNWYKEQCDGNWEHHYGITIETTDNPGWAITIDLNDTLFEEIVIPWERNVSYEKGWYSFELQNAKFKGSCDPQSLDLLLKKFQEIIENH